MSELLREDQLASAEGGSGDCAGVDDPFSCVLDCSQVYCSGCPERLAANKEGVGSGDVAAVSAGVASSCKVA